MQKIITALIMVALVFVVGFIGLHVIEYAMSLIHDFIALANPSYGWSLLVLGA